MKQENLQKISPIKQRILQFANTLNISKRDFYKRIGVSRGTLESNTGITEDIMAKFIVAFPNINPNWLLTGEGDRLLDGNVDGIKVISGANNSGIRTSIISNSQVRNSSQIKNDDKAADTEIKAFKIKIEFLEQMLCEKDKMIAEKERYIVLLEQQINKQ